MKRGWLLPGRFPRYLFAGLLVLLALAGGASRLDAPQQMVAWIGSIGVCAAVLLLEPTGIWRSYRGILWFFAACTLVVVVQLVPLPPAIWTALPGRSPFADAMAATGAFLPWHAANLTPDLGWASALSLLPPFAVLCTFASLDRHGREWILAPLIIIALASALLGLAQMSQGRATSLRLYEVVNEDTGVGLFANRNHQAALLALALPMMALWARTERHRPGLGPMLPWLILAAGLFLLGLLFLTGSRAGLLLAAVGVVSAILLGLPHGFSLRARSGGQRRALAGAGVLLIGAVVALALFSRNVALERLLASDPFSDQRVATIGPITTMIWTFFPIGSGFGSFSSVYRGFEPFELLSPAYLNHAHNELLEIAVEAGVPGLALLAVFLGWWGVAAFRLWFSASARQPSVLYGRLGTVMSAMLLVASVVDYPLRTPLLACVFTIACLWMHCGARAAGPAGRLV